MTEQKIYTTEVGRKFTRVVVSEPEAGSCLGCAASNPDEWVPTRLCRELNRECGIDGIFKEVKE